MPRMSSVAGRVRLRIKEELEARELSQRDLADLISRRSTEVWTQSRIGKVLKGRVRLCVEDVALIADVLDLPLSEIVRDRGLEFYAEMTPTEVRIIERLRQRKEVAQALLTVLDIRVPSTGSTGGGKRPDAVPPRRKRGRPKNSERTSDEA